jgi:hypothetical protein
MTIGDVLAAIAALGALGVCAGATLLLAALAFPERTQRAEQAITTAPSRCLGRGLCVLVVVGFVALALEHSPAGPARLLGDALWAGLFLIALLGGAGIARIIGERIQRIGTQMAPFAALTRGASLCVLAGFLPIIGWFLVTPLAILIALGGAFTALRPFAHTEALHEAPTVS